MVASLLQDVVAHLLGRQVEVNGWAVLAILVLAPVLVGSLRRSLGRYRCRRRCLAAVRRAYLAHADKLALNRARLVHPDDYGLEDTEQWHAHLDRFVRRIVLPQLRPRDQAYFTQHIHDFAIALLDEAARQKKLEALIAGRPVGKLSGRDFEQYCMEELRRQNWRARPTAASGDQGADIVAEHKGRAVVFQCKYHSAPIGNKAVQEVAAARHYYQAQAACVVSNQDYTRSARALAAMNNVFLIHYSELSGFRRMAFAG